MNLMEFIVGLAMIAFTVCASGLGLWLPGHYVLAPLRLRMKRQHGRWQLQLVDFFGLFVILQYGLVFVGAAWRWNVYLGQMVAVILMGAALAIWFWGIRSLTRAKIDDARRRFVLLSVVMPLVGITSLVYVQLAVSLVNVVGPWRRFGIIALVVMPLAMVGCRWLVNWIARAPFEADAAETGETQTAPDLEVAP